MSSARPGRTRATETLASLPAAFDANVGQFDDRVRFVAQGGGVVAWLVDGEVVVKLGDDDPGRVDLGPRSRAPTKCGGVLRMRFPSSVTPRGESRLSSKSNWFIGNDPAKWRTDVTSFGRARYESAARGVDVVWRGTRRALEYDVVVAPGADLAAFSMEIDGASSLSVDAKSGDLVVTTPLGAELRQSHPRCFQTIDGARRDVAGRFVVDGARVSFAADEWDRTRELVIDPTLDYSTYLGGNGTDISYSTAGVSSTGDIYVVGQTNSTNFPLASAIQFTSAGGYDASVTAIRSDGTGLLFSTYLGGFGNDYGEQVALDTSGNVYVAAVTNSTNVPTISAAQPSLAGAQDGYVVKLTPTGNSITYATYLGGSGDDFAYGLVVDAGGAAYVVGTTKSSNFPTSAARQSTFGGGLSDAFVTKLAPSGASFVYSTFHGGNAADEAFICALDAGGALVVGGYTGSTNLPINNAFQSSLRASSFDGFVAKYNAAGSALVFGTYLGGSGTDVVDAVCVDSSGIVYACGGTGSSDFPTASPTQAAFGGGVYDVFVTKFSSGGNSLAFSTYLGGSGQDEALGMVVDSSGGILVSGYTGSSNFPVLNAVQPTYGGGLSDGFVARFLPGAATPLYSTYFGGSAEDRFYGISIDPAGKLCLSGYSLSTDFPVRGAFQSSKGTGAGADVVVVRFAPVPPAIPSNLTADLVGSSTVHLTWIDTSTNETGFDVERRLNNGAFTPYVSLPAGTVLFDDTSVYPSQKYTYRVRSVGIEGRSAPTNEAFVVTPATVPVPPVPLAPDQLEAVVVSASEIDLSWRDRSNDELAFEVQRATGGASFAFLHSMPQDVATFADDAAPPGWPVGYRIRALAVQGPSVFTSTVTATTPGTMTLTTSAGLVVDSPKPKKDKVTWKGAFAFVADPAPATIDPKASGVRFQAGPPAAPVAVAIPAGDSRWKVAKKRTFTWTSAKGVVPKVKLVIDIVKKTYSLTATGFDYSAPADTSERLLFALGADAGGVTQTWVTRKPAGSFAPPKN
jgi:hypothetical protein